MPRVKSYLGLRQLPAAQDTYRQLARGFLRADGSVPPPLEFARTAYEAGDYATAASLIKQVAGPDQVEPIGAYRPCAAGRSALSRGGNLPRLSRHIAGLNEPGSLTIFWRPPC